MEPAPLPKLNSKNRRTLTEVFAKPTPADVEWQRVVALVVALGGTARERAGSRVVFDLNGRTHVPHQPHGAEPMNRAAARDFADFLRVAGVEPPAPLS